MQTKRFEQCTISGGAVVCRVFAGMWTSGQAVKRQNVKQSIEISSFLTTDVVHLDFAISLCPMLFLLPIGKAAKSLAGYIWVYFMLCSTDFEGVLLPGGQHTSEIVHDANR